MMCKKEGRYISILRLSRYIKEYCWYMILNLLCNLIYNTLPIVMTVLISYMVGILLAGKTDIKVGSILLVLVILVILRAILSYLDTWMSHDIAYRILAKLRIKLYKKIEELSPAFLQGNRSGRIASVALEDVEILEWFYAHTLGISIVSIIIIMIAGTFLAYLHPLIILVILPYIIFAFSVPLLFKKNSDAIGKEIRKCVAELNAQMVDGVNGIKDILSLNWQGHFRKSFENSCHEYEQKRLTDGKRRAWEKVCVLLIVGLSTFSVLLVCAFLVRRGELSSEWYPVAVALSSSIFAPIMEFLTISTQFGIIFASAGRVFNILNIEPNVKDNGKIETFEKKYLNVSFQNVSFTYPNEVVSAINGISFDVCEGETVALAGASGSGKSTIASLLQRYWEFDSGDIVINGFSIREYKIASLRAQIAAVPQDVYLFNTSITENLRMSAQNATVDQILEASKAAACHNFIMEMPDGYDTVVGEKGTKLSGGQRQRIAIARALLKNAKILIFDEASSSLDSENETYLNKTIDKFKKNKTTIVIAHRLSTLKSADRIIFLNEGRVVNIGSFDELMEYCPLFAKMTGLKWEENCENN